MLVIPYVYLHAMSISSLDSNVVFHFQYFSDAMFHSSSMCVIDWRMINLCASHLRGFVEPSDQLTITKRPHDCLLLLLRRGEERTNVIL